VDGVACGQNSLAVASATLPTITIGTSSSRTFDAFFDDVVISATAADYPIGAGYVNHFVPTADGTHNVAGTNDFERTLTGIDITNATIDAYLLVDEIPLDTGTPTDFINLVAPPNATDYVQVIYGPAPGINAATIAPRGVEVITVSAAAAVQTNNLTLSLNDNGSFFILRAATVGSEGCIYNRAHLATAVLGGPWVIGGGGNGDFTDLRMECSSSDATPDPYFVGTMIEAEFPQGKSDAIWSRQRMVRRNVLLRR